MKRLCIYLVYDKQNIVDKYIGYMLKELKTCMDYLVVVCNMPEVARGLDILETYADQIYYRENIGFDAGGFKDALGKFIGWKKVLEYDELTLVNDSMFGPFRPMKDIYAEMDEKSADFWGLAKHGAYKGQEKRGEFEHIQSYFLQIRYRMLHDIRFQQYWMDMPIYHSFWDVVFQHEEKFTHFFEKLGYTYTTLANTEINDSKINLTNNYSQYAMISFELIRKRNFPFLKKQQLIYDTLFKQTQENLYQSIHYIDKETDYDINLIWDNILRVFHMSDLQRSLCFQYIIPSHKKKELRKLKIIIVVFANYVEATETVLEYLQRFNSEYFFKIISEKAEILEVYQKCGLECKTSSWGKQELFSELCTYDFVCVLHDTDVTSDIQSSCTGKSYFYNIWENLLKDDIHVSGILEKFEEEPRLGFLTAPQPNFSSYFGEFGKGWNGKYEVVEQTIKEMGLNCQISRFKVPFRISDDFWIRGGILRKLTYLEKKTDSCLSYLWPYLAQDAGYYSGVVESSEYAAMNEINLSYYLTQLASQIRRECGEFYDFDGLKRKLLSIGIKEFCADYSEIFIYGIGDLARKYKVLVPNVKGYVISDGQKKPENFEGLPVKYLSELMISNNCGVVLCLNEENQTQVIPLLKARGIYHFFCI
ncbi:MAG: hypothetical protein HFI63_11875 [Lachnospiraceae bacterium]|nr:hypothetical protein [Lachnospiraceae bacterium]